MQYIASFPVSFPRRLGWNLVGSPGGGKTAICVGRIIRHVDDGMIP
jgi:hypothetical protein